MTNGPHLQVISNPLSDRFVMGATCGQFALYLVSSVNTSYFACEICMSRAVTILHAENPVCSARVIMLTKMPIDQSKRRRCEIPL